jgi:spore coat protein A, manganese oxidase
MSSRSTSWWTPGGNYLRRLLPVDPTLHRANLPGGTVGHDMRPVFTSTPGPYAGPVPIVTATAPP